MTVTPPSSSPLEPKPYELVSFPSNRPVLTRPAGHDRYLHDHLHGTLFLTLQVQTAVHVSTGVVALGSDVGSNKIPLVKTMTQTDNNQLVIQGSSLKGCVRAIYEAITNSTLPVITEKKKNRNGQIRYYGNKYPRDRKPLEIKLNDVNTHKLCPAGRIFGALNYQGLLQFNDARYIDKAATTNIGFMPSLYSPDLERKKYYEQQKLTSGEQQDFVAGRKFYYNMSKAIDKGENRGIPVQQAAKAFTFETVIHFKNLKPEELGILLIALGQDPEAPIALKLGGGKPIGMGTMTVSISEIQQMQNIIDRYQQYELPDSLLKGADLQKFMQKHIKAARNSKLLEQPQLSELAKILGHPSDRLSPKGMY